MNVPTEAEVTELCARAGLAAPSRLVQLAGGGNNQVFRIDGPAGSALLKAYFRHPDDPRDRLETEYSFCRFAWDAGMRCVPRPLASDSANAWGLYDFIEGRRVEAGEVTWELVEQAIEFFRALNRHRESGAARALANASDACFSLAENLQTVERRLQRLANCMTDCDEARALIDGPLVAAWRRVSSTMAPDAAAAGLEMTAALPMEERRLSPSDFGFHNCIGQGGALRFIDFEYAGWDDPAKSVCDFFCQPEVPVPVQWFGPVADAFAADTVDPARCRRRADVLMPACRVKWCCIMLNEFLPLEGRRRSFARDAATQESRRSAQLQKVRRALSEMPK
jgi:Phosphotransferase enzyme family